VPHTLMPYHGPIGGAFAEGALLTGTTAYYARITTGPASKFRLRVKASVGGALVLAYIRPGEGPEIPAASLAVYTAGSPSGSPFTVTDATESVIDVTGTGEAEVLVKFTPTGNSTVSYCDIMLIP